MKLSELEQIKTVDDFYKASTKLTFKDKGLVELFLIKRVHALGPYGMYPYFLHPLFNELTGNFRSRFIIVENGYDKVLILFKYVFVMTTKYIRLFGFPISLNDVDDNAITVLDILQRNNIVKQIISIFGEETEYSDSDFFCDINESWKHMNRSVWRSAHDINKVNKLGELTFKVADDSDKENMLALFELWKANKQDLSYPKFAPSLIKQLNTKGIIGTCLYFNGVLISYNIYYEQFDGTSLYAAVQNSIAKIDIEKFTQLDETKYTLRKFVGDVAFYKNIEYFSGTKVRYIYAAGESHVNSLVENKSKLYPNRIKYYLKEL
jgi:hypothetical protein